MAVFWSTCTEAKHACSTFKALFAMYLNSAISVLYLCYICALSLPGLCRFCQTSFHGYPNCRKH